MKDYNDLIVSLRVNGNDYAAKVIRQLIDDRNELRNELCYRCGQYATAHLGSCDGCKWGDG